jgi:phosphoribosyl-ATP pyrophosphohydrolase/phosphoribosyl-AMP cyclohydrolase
MEVKLQDLKFDTLGLIPAVVQDWRTGAVLMLAYMNQDSLLRTLSTGETWFFSRSRQTLWHKGETSGHIQRVKAITYDCDGDALLVEVEQLGPACHTGEQSCFHNSLHTAAGYARAERTIIHFLYDLVRDRRENPVDGSYTNYLFRQGIDKILKKLGEESAEVIIAAKNPDAGELIYELADLIYHSLVLMVERDITIADLKAELVSRHTKDEERE